MSVPIDGKIFPTSPFITPTRLHASLKVKIDASPGVVLEENGILSFPSELEMTPYSPPHC
jgi:hypothetical protein